MLSLDTLLVFEKSHWFFPVIVLGLLTLILAFLCARYFYSGGRVSKSVSHVADGSIRWVRLLGVIILLVVYFCLMRFVGDQFPNMGVGFLVASIPALWVFSLFYIPNFSKRTLFFVSINSCVAPLTVWFVLGQLMNLSLP